VDGPAHSRVLLSIGSRTLDTPGSGEMTGVGQSYEIGSTKGSGWQGLFYSRRTMAMGSTVLSLPVPGAYMRGAILVSTEYWAAILRRHADS
jgi:hypothetical protein